MFTDRGFSHALARIVLETDPTNEAALKMLQQPKNRAVVNGVTYDLDKVPEENVAEIWAEDVVSRLTLRATDAEGSAPSQAESNADNLSTSDGSAVPTRRS